MLSNKIIKVLTLVMALISSNSEAKVDQFQENFEGSFFREIQIDPIFYSGSSSFLNNDVMLSTSYEIVDMAPDFYYVFGTFSRDDPSRSFYGNFEFSVEFQDPELYPDFWSPYLSHTIYGSLSFNNDRLTVDGDVYEQNSGWGELKGFMTYQGSAVFTIDWTVFSGSPASNVPEPSPVALICCGLIIMGAISQKNRACG